MTDNELKALQVGDVIGQMFNGRVIERILSDVGDVIECSNPQSGAFGHFARRVRWESGTGNGWIETSIQSDEYTAGTGYSIYDAGTRIRGWEVLEKVTR